jgi:predicted ATPase
MTIPTPLDIPLPPGEPFRLLIRHTVRTRGTAMPSYILTGAPGAGKTAVLRLLETSGYAVVEEAATDVIALGNALGREEPWHDHDFIDKVIALQRQRQNSVPTTQGATVFFDRSPVCTLALSRYLGLTTSHLLAREVSRLAAEGTYETTVFFIRNQGFVQATAARRISFEDSLVFEQLHEQTYRDLGFQLAEVPAGPLADRVALVRQTVRQLRRAG